MRKTLLISASGAIAVALIAYAAYGPIRVLNGIRTAVIENDVYGLREFIDFDQARTSIKDQLKVCISQRSGAGEEQSGLEMLGAGVAMVAIEKSVDLFFTPDTIVGYLRRRFASEAKPISFPAALTSNNWDFRGPSRFQVTMTGPAGVPETTWILQRQWLDWRVVDLRMPQSDLGDLIPSEPDNTTSHPNFDDTRALTFLYGEYSPEREAALRSGIVLPTDDGRYGNADFPNGTGWAKAAFSKGFSEYGIEKHVLFAYTVPTGDDDFICHACNPSLSAAMFQFVGGAWQLEFHNAYLPSNGAYGVPPDVTWIALTPDNHAVLTRSGFMHQGHQADNVDVSFLTPHGLESILSASADNGENEAESVSLTIKFSTTCSNSDELPSAVIVISRDAEGTPSKVSYERYVYNGSKYVKHN